MMKMLAINVREVFCFINSLVMETKDDIGFDFIEYQYLQSFYRDLIINGSREILREVNSIEGMDSIIRILESMQIPIQYIDIITEDILCYLTNILVYELGLSNKDITQLYLFKVHKLVGETLYLTNKSEEELYRLNIHIT